MKTKLSLFKLVRWFGVPSLASANRPAQPGSVDPGCTDAEPQTRNRLRRPILKAAHVNRNVGVRNIMVDVYSGFTQSGRGMAYSGLVGSFFAPDVSFASQYNSAWHPFGLDRFGADMWGALSVESDGLYMFFLESDDVSLLYIDGNLVVDNGGDHGPQTATGSVNLTAGRHCFEVQFCNSGSGSGVDLHLPDGVSYACPARNCPSDVMMNSDPGVCGAKVTFPLPTLTEPCAAPLRALSSQSVQRRSPVP